MEEYRLVAIGLAGACAGAILGASIPTATERKVRGEASSWRPFSNASLIGIILNQLLLLATLGALVVLVSVGILEAASAYPLQQTDRYILAAFLLAGAALAKWSRYRYWKSKDPWR